MIKSNSNWSSTKRPSAKEFQFSSASNPLRVVRPLDKDGVESEIESLRSHHRGLGVVPMTPQIINEFCKSLVRGMFLFVGSDSRAYPKCFDSCMTMCKMTGAFQALSWNGWEDFAKLMARIEQTERLTRHTGLLHCPSAPTLMVAVAMQQVVLHGKTNEQDKVCRFLREFDCYNKAATAIYYFEKNYRQHVLTLDQVWHINASIQCPPAQSIEQVELATSDGRMQISRSNPYTRDVIVLEEGQRSVKEEPSVTYQAAPPVASPVASQAASPVASQTSSSSASQASSSSASQASSPAASQAASPAASQVASPAASQAASPAVHQAAENKEERHQETTSKPLSMSTPESSLVRETHKQVIRADIMLHLQPLLDRLKSEDWNGVIQRDIMQVLTDKNIKVLTASAKSILGMWATRSKNDMLLSWLEQARDDVVNFQWTERYVEPAPSSMWSDSQSAYNVFHDVDAMIAGIPQLTLRGQLRAKMNVLRDIFDQQERSHKEEMLNRVERVQMEVAKLSIQMAESQQMAELIQVAEPDQMAAPQKRDASFIEISDTDDDAVRKVKDKKKKSKREEKKTRKTETETKGDRKAGQKRSRREMEEE